MVSRKMALINLFKGNEWRCRCTEWTCGHNGGWESGTNGEIASTYILSGVRWIADEKMLCSTGGLVWYSVMTWRAGVGEEREAREGGHVCIIMAYLHCCMAETKTTL